MGEIFNRIIKTEVALKAMRRAVESLMEIDEELIESFIPAESLMEIDEELIESFIPALIAQDIATKKGNGLRMALQKYLLMELMILML